VAQVTFSLIGNNNPGGGAALRPVEDDVVVAVAEARA